MATKHELVSQVHAAFVRYAATLERDELLRLVSSLGNRYAYKLTAAQLRDWKALIDARNGANNGVVKDDKGGL